MEAPLYLFILVAPEAWTGPSSGIKAAPQQRPEPQQRQCWTLNLLCRKRSLKLPLKKQTKKTHFLGCMAGWKLAPVGKSELTLEMGYLPSLQGPPVSGGFWLHGA